MGTRITLTKAQSQSELGLELLDLLQAITADGRLDDDEVHQLRAWLSQADQDQMNAVGFLTEIVEEVVKDGFIGFAERRRLSRAIERVLPKALREPAVEHRTEAERQVGLLASQTFIVAGGNYEGRGEHVRRHVSVGTRVLLIRDYDNPHSDHAVGVVLTNGLQLGWVPEVWRDVAVAQSFADHLDNDARQDACVDKVLGDGHQAPRVRVKAYLFQANADIEGAAGYDEVVRALRPTADSDVTIHRTSTPDQVAQPHLGAPSLTDLVEPVAIMEPKRPTVDPSDRVTPNSSSGRPKATQSYSSLHDPPPREHSPGATWWLLAGLTGLTLASLFLVFGR